MPGKTGALLQAAQFRATAEGAQPTRPQSPAQEPLPVSPGKLMGGELGRDGDRGLCGGGSGQASAAYGGKHESAARWLQAAWFVGRGRTTNPQHLSGRLHPQRGSPSVGAQRRMRSFEIDHHARDRRIRAVQPERTPRTPLASSREMFLFASEMCREHKYQAIGVDGGFHRRLNRTGQNDSLDGDVRAVAL